MSVPSDHPQAVKLGWQIADSRTCFENVALRLREDRLRLPGGEDHTFAFAEQGGAVMIVPVTASGDIVTILQYRYPVDQHCVEVPAGTTRDTGGKPLEEVAAKELAEEIGGTFQRLESLGSCFTNPSLSDEECHFFLALGVQLEQQPDPEPMETIRIRCIPAREALSLAREGKMKTAPAALAVLLSEPRLRELGFL